MSDAIRNDRPAFPCDSIVERNQKGELVGVAVSSYGMTVREYFAAHAPITLAEAGEKYRLNNGNGTIGDVMDYLAKLRWAYADAMLKTGKSK